MWIRQILMLGAGCLCMAQDQPQDPPEQRWSVAWQATSIGQLHGRFPSPYSGQNSLQAYPERAVSLTSTLLVGLSLGADTQLYVDPELSGGRGFSGVTGLANSSNGELPRVSAATPKPYLARLYVSHDFGFGDERETVESGDHQLGGSRPMVRYTIVAGRFTVTDFFDSNRYSHDPRTQFMGWGIMYNGAWDYPADVRGYTWAVVHEFHTRNWSLRYGSAAEPRVANGLRFDRRLFRNRGDVVEGERRFSEGERSGTIRVLVYRNASNSGTYADALRLADQSGETPDVTATRRNGTAKHGVGVSFDQEIVKGVGIFGRLGWNDGKTESFAFTAIDRLLNAGVSVNGDRWKRKDDTVATALTVSGLSAVHAQYLARGGLDFLIGDGRLNYGTERVWESYYSARVVRGLTASVDLQYVRAPAYNRDRGPLWIPSLRLRMNY